MYWIVFFFNDTATTEIYTLSLNDALPILQPNPRGSAGRGRAFAARVIGDMGGADVDDVLSGVDAAVAGGYAHPDRLRSEKHTSEPPARQSLVCCPSLCKNKTTE